MAFNTIKEWLLSEPFLHPIDYNHSLYMATDASKTGAGGVLWQLIPDKEGNPQMRLVSFWSHRWSESQARRLHIVELEVLAAFLCIVRHQSMLALTPFYLAVDCMDFARASSSSNAMIQRCLLSLEGMGAKPVKLHIPGSMNIPSDACSRLCAVRPSRKRDMRSVRQRALDRWKRDRVISQDHRDLLKEHHRQHGAHVGVQATFDSMKAAGLYWEGIASDCDWWVRTCNVCQAARSMLPKRQLDSLITVLDPYSRLMIDVWTPKVVSKDGLKHVLVCVDTFSMYVQLFPLKSTRAEEIVPKLVRLMQLTEGVGEVIYSDDAAAFRSKIYDAFVQAFELTSRLVLPEHHNANGYAEHECYETCRVVRNLLLENAKLNQKDWPAFLPLVEWIRNSTPRMTRAGLSPRQILFPWLDRRGLFMKDTLPAGKYLSAYLRTQSELIELVRGELARWMDVRLVEIHGDGVERGMTFEPGDFVLVKNTRKNIGRSKFNRPFTGPYEVLGKATQGSDSYQLFEVLTGNEYVQHRDEMKLFNYRSMDDLVPMAMSGTAFVNVESVLSHSGSSKTGAVAYRFKCKAEDGDVFESSWEDVNRSNAYIKYREQHPEFKLPPTTQAPVAGPW